MVAQVMSAPTVLILLGPPGAGKGTQAARLSAALSLPHVATGDLFREHLARRSELGLKAQAFVDGGRLVPDDLVVEMLFERVSRPDCGGGFLLDGFPRTLEQARALDARLPNGARVRVLALHVEDATLIERLSGRLTCRACGHNHHLRFSPPRLAGRCDRCGGELYQRKDDARDVVERRLAVYRNQTLPVESHYERRGLVVHVDGERAPDDVFASLRRAARGEEAA
jgi:adenylate kinase